MTNPEDVRLQWDEQTPPPYAPLFSWTPHFPILLQQPMTLPQKYLDMLHPLSAVNYQQLSQRIPRNPCDQGMDYSAEAFLILRIFDREMTSSVVQWLRRELGIKMPDFFMKFEYGKHANYHGKNKNKKINFNHCQRDTKTGEWIWKAPATGQECTCTKTYCKRHKTVPFEKANNSFFWKWGMFVSARNRLYHTSDNDPFTLMELIALKNELDNFMLSYLPYMYALKKELSSPAKQENDSSNQENDSSNQENDSSKSAT
ncbi:MAG: hypothetical protein IKZ46_02970 [Victivallales bacterium]|nr:hypothetical protein [Victivallales bacterium]